MNELKEKIKERIRHHKTEPYLKDFLMANISELEWVLQEMDKINCDNCVQTRGICYACARNYLDNFKSKG
jgi:hypothetical protein